MLHCAPDYTAFRGIPPRFGPPQQKLSCHFRPFYPAWWGARAVIEVGRFVENFLTLRSAGAAPNLHIDWTSFYQTVRVECGSRKRPWKRFNLVRFGSYDETIQPGEYTLLDCRLKAEPEAHQDREPYLSRRYLAWRRIRFRALQGFRVAMSPLGMTQMAAGIAVVYLLKRRTILPRKRAATRGAIQETCELGPPRPESPQVTVGIPSYNRGKFLIDNLRALWRQTFPNDDFEIIVVDDGSTDGAVDRIAAAGEEATVSTIVIRQDNSGPAVARNRVLEQARGRMVAFLDDDCLAAPTWLERLAAPFRTPDIAGRGGFVQTASLDTDASRFLDFLEIHQSPIRDKEFAIWYPITCNALFDREKLQAVGGFDENFPYPGGEDQEVGIALRRAGYYFEDFKDAVVHHYHKDSIEEIMRVWYRYGVGTDTLWRKHTWWPHPGRLRLLYHSWYLWYNIGRRAIRAAGEEKLSWAEALRYTWYGYLMNVAWLLGVWGAWWKGPDGLTLPPRADDSP